MWPPLESGGMWSLLAGEGQARPSHHTRLSWLLELCKVSLHTRRAEKGSEEAVWEKQENMQ